MLICDCENNPALVRYIRFYPIKINKKRGKPKRVSMNGLRGHKFSHRRMNLHGMIRSKKLELELPTYMEERGTKFTKKSSSYLIWEIPYMGL